MNNQNQILERSVNRPNLTNNQNQNQILDRSVLNDLRDIMGAGFEPLIHAFIRDADIRLENLRKSLASQEGEKLRQSAHIFKGSCLNIGAKALVKICSELECLAKESNLSAADDLIRELDGSLRDTKQALLHYLKNMD